MIRVGTSGFAYKEWKGAFYPEKLPQKDYLEYYSQRLPTTEINATFYRSPSAQTVAGWAQKVPDGFRFTLKLNQRITHHKRLSDVQENMDWFFKGAQPLDEKLGCILVQLPPNFQKDLERLEGFLELYALDAPMAFEFRHDTWFCDETYDLLARYRQTLVVAETDESPGVRRVTAPLAYLRLRRSSYTEEQLDEWADWLKEQDREVLVYFKHEETAPLLARQLMDRLG